MILARTVIGGAVALDRISYPYPVPPPGITPLNPASGLSLVLLRRWCLPTLPLAAVAPVLATSSGWPS